MVGGKAAVILGRNIENKDDKPENWQTTLSLPADNVQNLDLWEFLKNTRGDL